MEKETAGISGSLEALAAEKMKITPAIFGENMIC